MHQAIKLRAITTLSAALEFYDFTLLIFLAPVIAANFFPESSGISGIMPVLMLFFAGYLARFFGGVLYGHGGDLHGRKRPYMYTIVVMSLSTLGIALLPGYEQMGICSPVALLVLRVLQGLSLGGEIPGSVVYASECSGNTCRGLATGLIVSGVTFGNVLASGMVTLLYISFGEQAVYDWGWRIAFAAGSCLGLVSLWLRLYMDETPVYQSMPTQKKLLWPGLQLIKQNKINIVRGTLLSAVPAVSISVLFFMPRFQKHFLEIPDDALFSMSFFAFFMLASLSLLMAIISDKVGRVPLMKLGTLLMIALVPLCIFLLIKRELSPFVSIMPLLLSGSMIMGVYEAGMVELFATESRYSGVGICHNMAFCFFGGLTPMLLEWLCNKGLLLAVGVWPAMVCAGLLVATFKWHDRYQHALDQC